MRRIFKFLTRAVFAFAASLIAIAAGVWKREGIMRLLAVNSRVSAEKVVTNVSGMLSVFLLVDMARRNRLVTEMPEVAQSQRDVR